MRRFAVFIQTFTSVVDTSKNKTAEKPVGIMEPPETGFIRRADFETMAKQARKTFGILPNQKPLFRELPKVVHIILENDKTVCGRDFAFKHYSNYSQFANCKNCLKKEAKNAGSEII